MKLTVQMMYIIFALIMVAQVIFQVVSVVQASKYYIQNTPGHIHVNNNLII